MKNGFPVFKTVIEANVHLTLNKANSSTCPKRRMRWKVSASAKMTNVKSKPSPATLKSPNAYSPKKVVY
jgi:hypothetical protein